MSGPDHDRMPLQNRATGARPPRSSPAQADAIAPARPLDRTVMHGEGDRIALRERDHLGARLHARPLLDQHELAAFEIAARLRQENRDLQRKDVLAIEVLMQAIVVADLVLKK